ncbi:MAG TPA: cell envelope integrity EipB family protein [Beijerinckiaceae bacterium]|jgi:hypothetical protein
MRVPGQIAAALVVCLGAAEQAGAEPVRLAPHRAVYDLSLGSSRGAKVVDSARGRIVFDFTGDACEGYALKYRQVTVIESSETGTKTSDLRNATFESGDGDSFRFKTDSTLNGTGNEVDGEAARRADRVEVRLKQPQRASFGIDGDTVFPSMHLKRLIEAARAGETTLSIKVFDGSDDGRKMYETLAVIGKASAGGSDALEAPARQDAMAPLRRWPVSLSYYAPGQGERTPVYVITFDLYENGVSRSLRLDYGDFVLKGDLQSLDFYPASACQR